jgi:hypothetical protein
VAHRPRLQGDRQGPPALEGAGEVREKLAARASPRRRASATRRPPATSRSRSWTRSRRCA